VNRRSIIAIFALLFLAAAFLSHAAAETTIRVATPGALNGAIPIYLGAKKGIFAIFDPQTVGSHEPEWAEDYPGNTKRLIQRSDGMHYTIVNGRIIFENGKLTGDLPGQVLRGTSYRVRRAHAA
jgi:hypothetical protein